MTTASPSPVDEVALRVVAHPLVADRLTRLRDAGTPPAAFRTLLDELAGLLAYVATLDLTTTPRPVTTPLGQAVGAQLADTPVLVPVLRAGLGMLPAFNRLLPAATIALVGLRRDERSLGPSWYLDGLPLDLDRRPVIVLDPMLATGGTLLAVLRELGRRRAGPVVAVSVLAAPEGIAAVRAAHPGGGLTLVTAAVDERLDDRGWIVPGLGDAGDRQA